MLFTIKKENNLLKIQLQKDNPEGLKLEIYECPVDIDTHGEIIGIEVEDPCHSFGDMAIEGLEFIELTQRSILEKTPEGRVLSMHAQGRPPLKRSGPWISYEREYDMLYICIAQNISKMSYEVSVPVECKFLLDSKGRIHSIEIPLDQIRKQEKK